MIRFSVIAVLLLASTAAFAGAPRHHAHRGHHSHQSHQTHHHRHTVKR